MSDQHYYYVWREKTGDRYSWTIPRRVQAEDSADALIASELKLGEGEVARVVRMTATTKFEGIAIEVSDGPRAYGFVGDL